MQTLEKEPLESAQNPYEINTPLLQLNDLCKRYPGMGNYMSVFHMNLTILRGRIIGLLGPNGCGKTTLIKMINGLLAPTSGTVLINGMEPCPATKRVISYLPERTYLDNGMKVSQMVEYFADFYEDFSTEKAYNMLGALGISSSARLKTLSKGTKEKVQLILVMSRQADLYILDEPIAGVDPAARDYILRTIITNYNPGSTIILSTHLISDIENILDDVIFMKNGSLMLYTSVDSIRSQMGKSVDTYFREVYAC
ncbi:MAG: ABC transporter ATP-binding protein [Lachnospiraceae bacterium]|nr:ABC transporter ATP-binding protein [Lachnospiraceae bacterium]